VSPSVQYVYAAVIVAVLLGLAGYFGWRQWQTLRGLRGQAELPPEDRRYYRTQAWLRLVNCGLMVVFAGLLAGTYLLGQERRADEFPAGPAAEERGADHPTAEERSFARWYTTYWIVLLLVLLAIVTLAVVDLLAIRRFGVRHFRKLQADRRAMIEREVSLLRSQRNGHE
jgi:hypothetical protein